MFLQKRFFVKTPFFSSAWLVTKLFREEAREKFHARWWAISDLIFRQISEHKEKSIMYYNSMGILSHHFNPVS